MRWWLDAVRIAVAQEKQLSRKRGKYTNFPSLYLGGEEWGLSGLFPDDVCEQWAKTKKEQLRCASVISCLSSPLPTQLDGPKKRTEKVSQQIQGRTPMQWSTPIYDFGVERKTERRLVSCLPPRSARSPDDDKTQQENRTLYTASVIHAPFRAQVSNLCRV